MITLLHLNLVFDDDISLDCLPIPHLHTNTQTRLGASSSELSVWHSDTCLAVLSCAWTALIKLEQNSVVTVGAIQIGCRSQSFSYDLLMVSGHRSPANAVPSGVAERRLSHVGWVSVVGSDFGSADSTATSREHSTAAQRSIWVSDSALLSRAAAGVAASRIAILTSGVSVSSCTDAFSFERVSLQREYSRMLPFGGAGGFPKWIANGPTIDGPALVVTLAGSGMSFADYTSKATILTLGTDFHSGGTVLPMRGSCWAFSSEKHGMRIWAPCI